MKILKRTLYLFLCVCMIGRMLIVFQKTTMADTIDSESDELIRQLIKTENEKNWDYYPQLWCDEEKNIFECLFHDEEFIEKREGILCVEAAELVSIENIASEYANRYISEYDEEFEDVKAFLVGINYEVEHVNMSFFNGVNYRIIILGYEKGVLKVIAVREAEEFLLNGNEDNIDKQIASQVIDERMEGKIVDSDMQVVEDYTKEYDSISSTKDNGIRLYGFRPGYSYTTKFNLRMPKEVRVLVDGGISKVNFPMYVKRVLPREMIISSSEMEALKAQVICIQQYATWNTIYYQKYPNQGFDVKAGESDQDYSEDSKDSSRSYDGFTNPVYRKKVDDAYAAVKNICMVIKDTGALFESRYCESKEYNKDGGPKMYQKGANILAAQGKNCFEILQGYYDNGKYPGYNSIQRIKFSACYK